jgi:hypothetical protein
MPWRDSSPMRRPACLTQGREGARGTTFYARVRWTHPLTHHREGVKRTFPSLAEARAWVEHLEGQPEPASTRASHSLSTSPSWEVGGPAVSPARTCRYR